MSVGAVLKHWVRTQIDRDTWLGRGLRHAVLRVADWRGSNRVAGEFPGYRRWVQRHTPTREILEAERQDWLDRDPPLVSVVIPVYRPDRDHLSLLLNSLRAQSFFHWQAVLVDDGNADPALTEWLQKQAQADLRMHVVQLESNQGIAAATNAGIKTAGGDFIAFVDQDDWLAPHALSSVMECFQGAPDCQCVFTDEDKLNAQGGRCEPYFKPGFNRALLYARNYMNHLTVVRRQALKAIGPLDSRRDGAQDFDVVLRLLSRFGPSAFRHCPVVAYSWRKSASAGSFSASQPGRAWQAGRDALADHLIREQVRFADIEPAFGGGWRVRFKPENAPGKLAVIIPTRDRAALLESCLQTLEAAVDPGHLELVIVDNDSREPSTFKLFDGLKDRFPHTRILRISGAFNYSQLVNAGVQASSAQKLLLLNNDVTGGQKGWLDEMSGWVGMPWVGCVGARLLYEDGRLQHGGIVLGPTGSAGHYERFALPEDAGAFGHLRLPRVCSAVTAACLMVRREVFEAVGGFDQHRFPVAFSDVDFCLRVREAGFENVWTPYASLTHLEGASRGRDHAGVADPAFLQACRALRERWGALVARDPYVNPALDPGSEAVRLREN